MHIPDLQNLCIYVLFFDQCQKRFCSAVFVWNILKIPIVEVRITCRQNIKFLDFFFRFLSCNPGIQKCILYTNGSQAYVLKLYDDSYQKEQYIVGLGNLGINRNI